MRERTGDLLTALAGVWFVGGLYLDGWAHGHDPGLETFFTPWHAVLYSGFAAAAAAVLVTRRAPGRRPALVGVGLFAAGGVLDLAWHVAFGVEADVEALVSPTHLLLATGMALVVAAPLTAAFARGETRLGPAAVLSATLLLSVLTFFTQLAHPLARAWPHAGNRPDAGAAVVAPGWPALPALPDGLVAADVVKSYGLVSFLFQAALLVGLALVLLRRAEVPVGAFTVLLGANGLLMAAMRDTLVLAPAWILAGLAADAFAAWLRPRSAGWRRVAFAASVPAGLAALWLGAVALAGGVWWSVHMWAGTTLEAALVGALVALAVAGPDGSS